MKFDLIFFFKRVWKYPPGLKETDRSLWTRKKKKKSGVIINNGIYMPAAKMKITKFQGLFSHRLQTATEKVHNHGKAALEKRISVIKMK